MFCILSIMSVSQRAYCAGLPVTAHLQLMLCDEMLKSIMSHPHET